MSTITPYKSRDHNTTWLLPLYTRMLQPFAKWVRHWHKVQFILQEHPILQNKGTPQLKREVYDYRTAQICSENLNRLEITIKKKLCAAFRRWESETLKRITDHKVNKVN